MLPEGARVGGSELAAASVVMWSYAEAVSERGCPYELVGIGIIESVGGRA
jgi:hypothetical protein